MTPTTLLTALISVDRLRLILIGVVALVLLTLSLTLTGGADARPMLAPCTYERPVCPTYTPR